MSLVTDYLRKQGNPYAKLSVDDELDPRRAYICLLQNPYAAIETSDDSVCAPVTVDKGSSTTSGEVEFLLSASAQQSINQKEFEIRCRSLFFQYTPLRGGRRVLQPVYRDFISRAKLKDGRQRIAILQELERFDLTVLGGINPHLNREREDDVTGKLAEILRKYDA